ncbi:hypothetical protein NIES25_69930 (plasmid) [Nostoc linckia NIES-25]|nr:hypothetical protein NIES25_69930 [Nostoc linckia NIES-25]
MEQNQNPNWSAAIAALERIVAMNNLEVARVSSILYLGAMIMCSSIVDYEPTS